MAKEGRQQLAGIALGGWQRRLDLVPARRYVSAPLVALLTLALLLIVLVQAPLGALPDYPAASLVFLFAIVLPGLIVQHALLPARTDAVTRLAVAPALGLALLTVPGFIALEAHMDLRGFEVLYAFVAAAACGAAVYFSRGNDEKLPDGQQDGRGGLVLTALLLIVLGGVVTTPLWANQRLSADFDDWTYMAYVQEFLGADALNDSEPFLGTGDEVNPRMRDNVWVLSQAMVADAADIAPVDLLLQIQPPVLTVFALLMAYALTRVLFGSRAIGLLAALMLAGYGLIDLSAHEGFGRNLFMRISEDKMSAAWVLFPVALIFLTRYVTTPSRRSLAGFVLAVLALAFVHPVPLVFLGTAIAALALLRFAQERTWRTLISPAVLAIPVGLASVWPFIQRQLLVDVAPDLFEAEASSITFRDEFHVVELGRGLLMGNYHMILHPLVIAAIVLTPIVWFAARRSTGHQLVLAMTVGSLLVFFTPIAATPVAKLMTPQTLWKVPWMIPTAAVLAWAAYQAAEAVRAWRPLRFVFGGRRLGAAASALAPGLLAAVLLASAVVVMEQYARVDNRTFYDWTSTDTVVPGTSESIFRGGLDRSLAGTWRLDGFERDIMVYMGHNTPAGSVVLAEPLELNRYIPGILDGVSPVDFGGTAGEGDRRREATAFAQGVLSPAALEVVIDKYGVDYIVVMELGPATEVVESTPRAELIRQVTAFNVYQVLDAD